MRMQPVPIFQEALIVLATQDILEVDLIAMVLSFFFLSQLNE